MGKIIVALAMATVCAAQQNSPDTIRPGDVLSVEVPGAPELSQNVQVNTEGNIFFPGVPGAIRLTGMTTGQAAARMNATFQAIGLRDPGIQLRRSGSSFRALDNGRTEAMVTEIIPLHNSNAKELSASLQGMNSQGGNMSYYEDSNVLIVTDSPAAIQSIINAVNRLDQMQTQLTQVRIEAKVAEVRVGALKELGINWFVQGKEGVGGFNPLNSQDPALVNLRGVNPAEAFNTGAGNNNGGGNSSGGGGSGVGFVEEDFKSRLAVPIRIPLPGQSFIGFTNSHVDIGAMLDALVVDNNAALLANPMFIATNNRASVIKMVDEIPYTQFTTQITGATSSTVEFIELGITLDVTPHIYRDREGGPYVELDLKAEVSFPIGSNNGVPVRSLRSLSNRAHVRDNQTLVIGGILREDERAMDSKVPGLGNLPLFGRLFKKEEKTDFRSELMVFVTPTIYRKPEDITWDRMIDISENLRDKALIPEAAIRGETRKN